jgi:hypothetical protein
MSGNTRVGVIGPHPRCATSSNPAMAAHPIEHSPVRGAGIHGPFGNLKIFSPNGPWFVSQACFLSLRPALVSRM